MCAGNEEKHIGVMVEMLRRGVYLVLRGRSAWRGFRVANGSVSILLECTDSALLELLVCLCTRREFSRRWGLRRRNMSLECLGETVYLVAHFFLLDRKRGRAHHYFLSYGALAWWAWIDSSYATSPVFCCVLWCCPRCWCECAHRSLVFAQLLSDLSECKQLCITDETTRHAPYQ